MLTLPHSSLLLQSIPAASSFQYGQSPYAAAAPSAPTPSFMQQQDDEPESEAITSWKVKQAEEIKARDEKSKVRSGFGLEEGEGERGGGGRERGGQGRRGLMEGGRKLGSRRGSSGFALRMSSRENTSRRVEEESERLDVCLTL